MCKTRNWSTAEYFLLVQKEYIQAELRRKIYPNAKDKRYYLKVMNFKKEKIEDISERCKLKNIFNSKEKLQEVKEGLFTPEGVPTFLEAHELAHYYFKGSDFSYDGEIYKLFDVNWETNCLFLKKGEDIRVNVEVGKACRIL